MLTNQCVFDRLFLKGTLCVVIVKVFLMVRFTKVDDLFKLNVNLSVHGL